MPLYDDLIHRKYLRLTEDRNDSSPEDPMVLNNFVLPKKKTGMMFAPSSMHDCTVLNRFLK